MLRQEIKALKQKKGKNSNQKVHTLQKAILDLEKSVLSERKSHYHLVEKLRSEKSSLVRELKEAKISEQRLKNQISKMLDDTNFQKKSQNMIDKKQTSSVYTIYRNTNNMKRNNYNSNINNKAVKPPPVRRSRSTPTKTSEKR